MNHKKITTIISLLLTIIFISCSDEKKPLMENKKSTIQEVVVINGYTLPPMPDETLNNSTLLGIDSNDNGVRDDVERYLLDKYKDHHKIVSEIALQSGRAFQIVLENPENARETTKLMSAARYCYYYFEDFTDSYGNPILIDNYIMEYKYKELQLNTKDRIKAYLEYNHNLSGGVYRAVYGPEAKNLCDFNVTELLKSK